MTKRLAAIDPGLQQWRVRVASHDEPDEPPCPRATFYDMPVEMHKLARIFDENRSYKRYPPDSGRPPEVWPEMGFNPGMWNGLRAAYSAGISMRVGGCDLNHPQPNGVDLRLPERRLTPGATWTGSELRPALMAIVEAWEATYAVVRGGRYVKYIPRDDTGRGYRWPWAGWLTYLSPPKSLLVRPPEDAKSERFADGGLLVTLCEEPFDVDNPQHMAVADEMQRALRPVQW